MTILSYDKIDFINSFRYDFDLPILQYATIIVKAIIFYMTQTPKDVVRSAYEYLLSVSQSEKISLVRIEELDQNDGFWKVVLSYEVTGEFMFERQRLYKEFSVSDVDCKVLSMKIKQI